MSRGRMLARFGALGAAALLCLSGGPALAAAPHGKTVTVTEHTHGTWVETDDTNPCTGDTITVTVTGNGVQHVTYFTNSDEFWGTFTETGKGTFTDSGVTYTGHFTVWGNFNLNEKNANTTFTFSLRFTGSDGSVVIGHEVAHMSWFGDPDTTPPTLSFDKMKLTCG